MKTTAAKPMSQLERYILLTFGVLLDVYKRQGLRLAALAFAGADRAA